MLEVIAALGLLYASSYVCVRAFMSYDDTHGTKSYICIGIPQSSPVPSESEKMVSRLLGFFYRPLMRFDERVTGDQVDDVVTHCKPRTG